MDLWRLPGATKQASLWSHSRLHACDIFEIFFLPLTPQLSFSAAQVIPVTSKADFDLLKSRIANTKAEIRREEGAGGFHSPDSSPSTKVQKIILTHLILVFSRVIKFQMSVVKTKTKQSPCPITKNADNPVNQSKLEANTCSRHEARENVRERVTVSFGFTSDWL